MRPRFPFGDCDPSGDSDSQFAPFGPPINAPSDRLVGGEAQRRAGYIEAAEFEQVIRPGFRYVLEEAGVMNGRRLWSIFRQRIDAVDRGERR